MCEEWRNDFNKFREWALSHGYGEDLAIDRLDNDKDYCPENCKWSTVVEQANHTSHCHYVYDGDEKLSLSQFADGDCHCFEVTNKTISSNFIRIGAYDFTKKEKKKIESISDCNKNIFANAIKSDNQLVRMVSDEIFDKINELVNVVNKLIDKENN